MSYKFSFKKFVNSDLVKTPTDVAAATSVGVLTKSELTNFLNENL